MYRCDKCGRDWDDQLAAENDWACFRKCGGRLKPIAGTAAPTVHHAISPSLASLPSVLAIPLAEFAGEMHPVMRLHRLCDAVEIVTRFCTIAALGELRTCLGDSPFPKELLEQLQPHIERPTFGRWRNMLEAAVRALGCSGPLLLPELPEFVSRDILPYMSAGKPEPETDLVEMRNRIVHGGALSQEDARRYLTVWQDWLGGLPTKLAFLSDAELVHYHEGQAGRLVGLKATSSPITLSVDLRQALKARGLDGHVLLLRHGRWLDLWPLCDYGRATTTSLSGRRRASTPGPQVFLRADRDRLLYAALGVDVSHGERFDAVAEFRELFRLDERISPHTTASDLSDYEQELQADAQMMVGRVQQLSLARSLLQRAQSGIFWLSGPGGIGKSLLTAALAMDPAFMGDSKKICRIAWRFKASDTARCRRGAFLRHAVQHLAEWLQKTDFTPDSEERKLQDQFVGLLDEIANLQRPSSHSRSRAKRVLFIVDGLDEIERSDELLPRLILQWQRENVVWLCSGRAERTLPKIFDASQCRHVFPSTAEQPEGGLPPMSDDDIRGMLLDGLGDLKYDLLQLDEQQAPEQVPVNPAVAAVVRRARGLPLYVHFVVQDLLSGHIRAQDLTTDKLPADLERYYDDLLKRLSIGDLQALLTPLMTTVAWAKAPLPEGTLHLLMVRRTATTADEAGRALVRQGLEALQSMLRAAPLPDGRGYGYEPYHLTFQEHIRRDPAGVLRHQNQLAQESLCSLISDWSSVPAEHPARDYVLRHGPTHLRMASRFDDLETLLTDLSFLEAKNEAGLVFDLAGDFTAAWNALPETRPQRRILGLLDEALRRDIHFIHRHHEDYPLALFQCLWNTGWWYDSPQSGLHFVGTGTQMEAERPLLSELMEAWKCEKVVWTRAWLQCQRPPSTSLQSGLRLVLDGHEAKVSSVAFSPKGTELVSCSYEDGTVKLWDLHSGNVSATYNVRQFHGMRVFFLSDQAIIIESREEWSRVLDIRTNTWRDVPFHTIDYIQTCVDVSADTALVRLTDDFRSIAPRLVPSGVARNIERLVSAESLRVIAIAPRGLYLLITSEDKEKEVWVWNATTNERRQIRQQGSLVAAALSPDGSQFACVHEDCLEIFKTEDGGRIACVSKAAYAENLPLPRRLEEERALIDRFQKKHGSVPPPLLWSSSSALPGSRRRSKDSVVSFDAMPSRRPFVPNEVEFSPVGTRLALRDYDTVVVLDLALGSALCKMTDCVGPLKFLNEDKLATVARIGGHDTNGTVLQVWDLTTGKRICEHRHSHAIEQLARSPDGTRVATTSEDVRIRLWDSSPTYMVGKQYGHDQRITFASFSTDGRLLRTNSSNGTTWLWDVRSGRPVGVIRVDDGHNTLGFEGFRRDGSTVTFDGDDPNNPVVDLQSEFPLHGEFQDYNATVDRAFHMESMERESIVRSMKSGEIVACFPATFDCIRIHPTDNIWAGMQGNHTQILEMNCVPSSPTE